MKLSIFIFMAILLMSSCSTGQDNKSNSVVKLKQTGSEYQILKSGNGKESKPGDEIHFSLLLISDKGDTLADKRTGGHFLRDIVRPIDSTTQDVMELLYTIKEGDSVKMQVPVDPQMKSRYMELQNVDSLTYYIKLIEVVDKETLEARQAEAKKREAVIGEKVKALLDDYKAGKLDKKLKKTPNGVQYYIIEKGNGKKVEKGDKVSVAYYGVLKENGKMFDNSFIRDKDLDFVAGVGQMIKGWDEAMLELHEGDKAIIFIPYNLGYGDRGMGGVIPPKSDLVFYLEVHKVEK